MIQTHCYGLDEQEERRYVGQLNLMTEKRKFPRSARRNQALRKVIESLRMVNVPDPEVIVLLLFEPISILVTATQTCFRHKRLQLVT